MDSSLQQRTLRQLKDIQHQGGKIINQSATVEQIRDFAIYSQELSSFLFTADLPPEIERYVLEIPPIDLDQLSPKKGIMTMLPSIFSYYLHERRVIDEGRHLVREACGKFAAIEFMLKGYWN